MLLIMGADKLMASNEATKQVRSPLRYPGGKARAISCIVQYIPRSETLCAPFLGGGSVELACTSRMKVYGSDIFKPLATFWKILLKDAEELARCVECYYPLSKDRFYALQKSLVSMSGIEQAAAFFVLNRASFSGTTLSGGMSPGHPRFTWSAIERLRRFKVGNFSVSCSDYKTAIRRHGDAFLYLDPPYMTGQALYGVGGNTHKGFDHAALAEFISKRDRWILSYNDCPEIRELYKSSHIMSVKWKYGMSNNKNSNEILIASEKLSK